MFQRQTDAVTRYIYMESRDVFVGARIYISVAFARIGDAIARTRPTEASRSILGRMHLRTPSRGALSAVLAAGTADGSSNDLLRRG